MKKVTLFIVVIAIITCSQVDAAIITVDNKTPSIGNYTTLQAAHDAASAGDTIYVYPSDATYSGITLTKNLTFVGTGFNYPSEGMNTTRLSGTMTFDAGSNGSALKGFGGGFSVDISADNITIERNSIATINVGANNVTIKANKIVRIVVRENHTGTVIIQNDVVSGTNVEASINVEISNELLIANNKIVSTWGYYGVGVKANSSTITITLLHNVIKSASHPINVSSSNKFIANNIIVRAYYQGSAAGSGYYYNMGFNFVFPEGTGSGNITNVDMDSVFVDPDNYDFHLLPDSPAIGAGHNGADMGIYGGSTPFMDDYVAGSCPGLPSIYYLQSDHVGTKETGLDVTIKAKSNME